MKKLNVTQMENLQGGFEITMSNVVCTTLGAAAGAATAGFGVFIGFACSAMWKDIEGRDTVLWSW